MVAPDTDEIERRLAAGLPVDGSAQTLLIIYRLDQLKEQQEKTENRVGRDLTKIYNKIDTLVPNELCKERQANIEKDIKRVEKSAITKKQGGILVTIIGGAAVGILELIKRIFGL